MSLCHRILTKSFQYLAQKKEQLAALGEWTHINCLRPSSREQIKDDVLRQLIHTPKKNSLGSSVSGEQESQKFSALSTIDLDMVTAWDDENRVWGVREVPGGTISFLFEKESTDPSSEEADSAEV
jgi:DNA repair and recombination protein RAD54B